MRIGVIGAVGVGILRGAALRHKRRKENEPPLLRVVEKLEKLHELGVQIHSGKSPFPPTSQRYFSASARRIMSHMRVERKESATKESW